MGYQLADKVLLDGDEHHDLTVSPRCGQAFGDAANVARLFPTEFIAAQKEFPILLQRDETEGWQAVALTGFERGSNLFLADERWTSRYVPAVQRRGPFSIALRGTSGVDADPAVHVDLSDTRVGAPDGLRLFTENGGNTPYLDFVLNALRTVHTGVESAPALFAAWEEAGLIEPVRMEVELTKGRHYAFENYATVDADRLTALPAEVLSRLNAQGFLAAAFAVSFSMANVAALIDLWRAGQAETAA